MLQMRMAGTWWCLVSLITACAHLKAERLHAQGDHHVPAVDANVLSISNDNVLLGNSMHGTMMLCS